MATITELTVRNIKRISAVQLALDGAGVVLIGGENGAGKSSTLDAIEYLFRGKKAFPARPVRDGEDEGDVACLLSNGWRARRVIQPDGRDSLTLIRPDGGKQGSPQTQLNEWWSGIAFDPLEFSRFDGKKQQVTLRQLVGVDTSALDAKRQRLFDSRTEKNREVKSTRARLEAAPHHAGAPEKEVSVAALAEEVERLQAEQRQNDATREAARRAEHERLRCVERVRELERQLAEARAELAIAEGTQQDAQAAARALKDPDVEAVRARLRSAEEDNRKVRDNAARASLEAELAGIEAEAADLTKEIEAVDRQKAETLAAVKFPVPGLGFGEDGVTFGGVPLEQASQAERLRVSVAIGLAMNPEIKVLLVREGALLGQGALRMVAEMADAAGAQIFVERVGDGDEGAIVIEEGAVRAAAAAPAEAPAEEPRFL